MKHHLTARPCQGEDYEFVYDLKKQCYHDYVAAIWGWEEEKQRVLFAAYWEKAAPGLVLKKEYHILVSGKKSGLYLLEKTE